MTAISNRVAEAKSILQTLDFPRAQVNERSALCLLALLNLKPSQPWANSSGPLIGITPMMEFMEANYEQQYAPNSREGVRRQTIHQFVAAGLALRNSDDPGRPTNSSKTVYQIEPLALDLMKSFGSDGWALKLGAYVGARTGLAQRYAMARDMKLVPLTLSNGELLRLSPGKHSQLIADIVQGFAPRFAPGATLIYVGETGQKVNYFDEERLAGLGVRVDIHGKMPDVILYDTANNWLLLVEAVTSHGPVDGKRHAELAHMFGHSSAPLVYITAFPSRAVMAKYSSAIAWETEVWVSEDPTHLIHFNGDRYLGPHPSA